MTFSLDIRTLSFASAVVAAILFGYMLQLQLKSKTCPGFKPWTLAALSAGLGLILLTLRGRVPDLISVVGANTLLLLTMPLICRGLATLGGLRPKISPHAGLMIGFLGLVCWFTYGQASVNWRIILFSLFNGLYALYAARLAAGPVATLMRSRNLLLIGTLAAYGAFFLLRALLTFFWERQLSDLMAGGILQALPLLASFVGQILTFVGLVFLNIQKLELDLTTAQEELKLLGGLLPICAHCKRIRDDGGYWHQVEQYISAHSQAAFTHGICPQCLRELYPNMADSVLESAGQKAHPPSARV
jgi:hypothetical protein